MLSLQITQHETQSKTIQDGYNATVDFAEQWIAGCGETWPGLGYSSSALQESVWESKQLCGLSVCSGLGSVECVRVDVQKGRPADPGVEYCLAL